MKRYLLFSGYDYYPSGGWDDFAGEFDTVEEARVQGQLNADKYKWFHIVDTETKQQI